MFNRAIHEQKVFNLINPIDTDYTITLNFVGHRLLAHPEWLILASRTNRLISSWIAITPSENSSELQRSPEKSNIQSFEETSNIHVPITGIPTKTPGSRKCVPQTVSLCHRNIQIRSFMNRNCICVRDTGKRSRRHLTWIHIYVGNGMSGSFAAHSSPAQRPALWIPSLFVDIL